MGIVDAGSSQRRDMKCLNSDGTSRALTLIDVLIVVATFVFAIVLGLLLPSLARPRSMCTSSPQSRCVNNLRQVGLAFRVWADDHGEQFPWNVPQTNGGTMEFATSTQVWRHFQIASNEMNSPKILYCPSDTGQSRANGWQPSISNGNVSYFIGLDADETKPQSILSGDRNLSTNNNILAGVMTFPNPTAVHWTSAIHKGEGNFGLGDGSVIQVSARNLFQSVTNAGVPLRLSIP